MPLYDVRYRYTDTAGAVYTNKTVVDAVSGDNAVSLAAANLATRLPTNRWEIVGVAPSVAFSDGQDDVGAVGSFSPAALSIGGVDAMRAVATANAVNFMEAVPGATGTPGRVQLRAAGSDTNVSLALTPKGTGALLAQVPDSAATGGNARGANAVDFQTSRSVATMVASGQFAGVLSGNANTASAQGAVVCGGQNNLASAANAFVGGGGNSNAASGIRAVVVGGSSNTASGQDSVISGGFTNTAGGLASWIPGGARATTRGINCVGAWAGFQIAAQGDCQTMAFPLGRQTTDATQTRLTTDNAAASTANQIVLPNFSSYAGVLRVTAKAAGSTDAAIWVVNCGAVRGNGVGTVVALGGGASIAPTLSNGTGSTWRLAITADTTNGALAVDGTGAAATTINWAATFIGPQAVTAS